MRPKGQGKGAQQRWAEMQPPAPAPTGDAWFAEANALHRELRESPNWAQFPRGIQHAVTGLFAARLRRLQDEAPPEVKVVVKIQLKADFSSLTTFSTDQQPGWVAGLGRGNTPENGGSWTAEAEHWWGLLQHELGGAVMESEIGTLNPEVALQELTESIDEGADGLQIRRGAIRALNAGVTAEDNRLTRMLIPHLDALTGDKGLKRLRRAVRAVTTSPGQGDAPEPADVPLPADWPLWSITRGKTAILVGGEPREAPRARIQAAFEFETLLWAHSSDIRAMQRLADRIHGGSPDLVILLARFISHKVTDILMPALRDGQVAWASVERGYGVTAIQRALERYRGEQTLKQP